LNQHKTENHQWNSVPLQEQQVLQTTEPSLYLQNLFFSTSVKIIFEAILLRIRLSPSELNKAPRKDIIKTRANSCKLAASSLSLHGLRPLTVASGKVDCVRECMNRIRPKYHFSQGSFAGFVQSITCPNQHIYAGGIPKKQKQSLSESTLLCRRASHTKIHQSSRTVAS